MTTSLPPLRPRHLIAGLLALLQALAALTSAEIKANVAALRLPMAMLAASAGLIMIALSLLLVAGVLALAAVVGATAATAIVALITGTAGLALGWNGWSRLERTNLAPRRSIATLEAQIDRFTGMSNTAAEAPKDDTND